MARANAVHEIKTDHRRNEIQVFRNGGIVRGYPSNAKRLETLRRFANCGDYRFRDMDYGFGRVVWVRPARR